MRASLLKVVKRNDRLRRCGVEAGLRFFGRGKRALLDKFGLELRLEVVHFGEVGVVVLIVSEHRLKLLDFLVLFELNSHLDAVNKELLSGNVAVQKLLLGFLDIFLDIVHFFIFLL